MLCTPIPLEEKNLRYWVFAWYWSEPVGGLEDLVGTYDSLDEAHEAALKEQAEGSDCWEILDTHSMSLVGTLLDGIGPDGVEKKVGRR